GESEYLLGGQSVRLKDIHELFMDTGLGKGGYSMVSQGRVADLVSSRSRERRDMLEEAAGISQFRSRRHDATRRLAQTEENLVRLRDIIAELEDRVGPLKAQSEKAKQYLELAERKKSLEIALWLYHINKDRAKQKEHENKLHLARLQYDDLEKELEKLSAEIEQTLSEGRDITARIEHLQSGSARREEQALSIEAQVQVAQNSIAHHEAAIARLEQDKNSAGATLTELEQQMGVHEKEIVRLDETLKTGEVDLAALTEKTESLRLEREELFHKDKELAQELAAVQGDAHELDLERSRILSARGEIGERLALLDADAGERELRIVELDALETDSRGILEQAREKAQSTGNAIAGYEMLLQAKQKKQEKLKAKLDELSLAFQKLRERLRLLQELERNMEGYVGAVKIILKEGERGTLRGIHGTLSQLIRVEEKYALAIETALGGAMQFVVVDSDKDAKRAVEVLREKRGGRATFLPINTIRGRDFNEGGVHSSQGFIACADELTHSDAQYREIISAQLSRTVICDTMDNALAMARRFGHRFRIVTLDGQVINAGGSITGGSKIRGAGFLTRQTEINSLERELETEHKSLADTQMEYTRAAEERNTAAADLDGAKADWQNACEEQVRCESEHKLALERLASAKFARDNMEKEREAAQERLAELADNEKGIGEKIAALKEEIEQLNKGRFALEKERDEALERLEDAAQTEQALRLRLTECHKDIDSQGQALEQLRQRSEFHGKRVGELDEEIAGIAANIEESKAAITAFREQIKALRSDSGDNKEEIAALVEERNSKDASGAGLRAKERELTQAREGLGGEVARLDERRNSLLNAVNETQNKLFDEYQLTEREAQRLGLEMDDNTDTQKQLDRIKGKIRSLGSVNLSAVEEYKEVSERYEFMTNQCNDVEESRQELGRLIRDLTAKMSQRFTEQFAKVQAAFSETFSQLFGGGKAQLGLENQLDPLECEVLLSVQPPGKNVQNIDLLSGGEKGLAAIALLFAILKINPAPFCVFDEVEAALDDVNVMRYAKYVRRMCNSTQFILITHRRGTMEEADVLYGVTMQEEGVSKLLEMRTTELARELELE
ncbi:MAG: chromosome segregation protein SMC, partial [Oscillospiraceae bacterium]|nr:chromosome segregation protein SMC [Oscillospiraceae bacterium]